MAPTSNAPSDALTAAIVDVGACDKLAAVASAPAPTGPAEAGGGGEPASVREGVPAADGVDDGVSLSPGGVGSTEGVREDDGDTDGVLVVVGGGDGVPVVDGVVDGVTGVVGVCDGV